MFLWLYISKTNTHIYKTRAYIYKKDTYTFMKRASFEAWLREGIGNVRGGFCTFDRVLLQKCFYLH